MKRALYQQYSIVYAVIRRKKLTKSWVEQGNSGKGRHMTIGYVTMMNYSELFITSRVIQHEWDWLIAQKTGTFHLRMTVLNAV